MTTYTPITILADIISQHGPIPTVRVSSAQASGRAKRYSYWGAVRYEIRLTGAGHPANIALERASSDRRSVRGAERDADAIAEAERRIDCSCIGTLSDAGAATVLAQLAWLTPSTTHRDSAAAALAAAMAEMRSIPHWLQRAAAGVLLVQPCWLTVRERGALRSEQERVERLRRKRAEWRAPRDEGRRSVRYTWRGIPLAAVICRRARKGERVIWGSDARLVGSLWTSSFPSRRAAAMAILRARVRRYGRYRLARGWEGRWHLSYEHRLAPGLSQRPFHRSNSRPTRSEIAAAIRTHRAAQPSRLQPDSLGWRAWRWDAGRKRLVSPHQTTVWESVGLEADDWSDDKALRGVAGIHARRMPRDWRRAGWSEPVNGQDGPMPAAGLVTGIVERYGRYVLGTTGWRSERAIIRELRAPHVETMVALMAAYPEVRVHLAHQEEVEP